MWRNADERDAENSSSYKSAVPPPISDGRRIGEDADDEEDEGEPIDPSAALSTLDASSLVSGPTSIDELGNDTADADTSIFQSIGSDAVSDLIPELPQSGGQEAMQPPYAGPRISAIPQVLVTACERLNQVAFALGRIQMDAGLEIIPSEYMRTQLNYGLLLPTYAWSVGVPFAEICYLTECPEGTIVVSLPRITVKHS